MAKADRIPTDLTIDLGDDLSPEEFVAAIRNFMGFVREITDAHKGDGPDIGWTVKVREGSALVGVEPSRSAPRDRLEMIYKAAKSGAETLARGDMAGVSLSPKAVNHLKSLSDLATKSKSGKGINMWVRQKPIGVGADIAKAIRDHREPVYRDFGTIEGKLEGILDLDGKLTIKVRDFLYSRAINCIVPETMLEKVLKHFRKDVGVDGFIHYRPDGTPASIEVQEIDELPDEDDLPSIEEMRGILAEK